MPRNISANSTTRCTIRYETFSRPNPPFEHLMFIRPSPTKSRQNKPRETTYRAEGRAHTMVRQKEAPRMSAKNVKTLRAAHESWNKRDFAGVIRNSAENLTYTDHARPLTLNTREKFRERTEGWAKAFSDGRITNPQYIDAGDIVVAQFTA